jgi:hypothetical protein
MLRTNKTPFLQLKLKLKSATCFGQLGSLHQVEYEEYKKGIFSAAVIDCDVVNTTRINHLKTLS